MFAGIMLPANGVLAAGQDRASGSGGSARSSSAGVVELGDQSTKSAADLGGSKHVNGTSGGWKIQTSTLVVGKEE